MRLDSALKEVVPNISRPKKSRHFLMKLPDNFQMREHSWPCRFHIILWCFIQMYMFWYYFGYVYNWCSYYGTFAEDNPNHYLLLLVMIYIFLFFLFFFSPAGKVLICRMISKFYQCFELYWFAVLKKKFMTFLVPYCYILKC